MKKLLIVLFSLSLFANQIENNTKKLEQTQNEKEQISKKLEDLASEIIEGEQKLKEINEKVKKTSNITAELQELVNAQNGELNTFITQNKELMKDKEKLGAKLVEIIAKDFSYDLIAPKDLIDSSMSIVSIEVLNTLSEVLNNELYKISKDYARTQQQIDYKQKKISEMNVNIDNYKKQAKELSELKKRQENLISKQKQDEKIYKQRLTNLQKQQDEIRATLAKLKIIENEKSNKKSSQTTQVKHSDTLSYDGKVAKYTGAKTIAPLVDFSVKQKFGDYIDPIYKLKIFNENVVLRSNTPDANVRVVFDGKVVFANDTAVLDKVVIVEHANGIHTIYAHLSKFSKLAKVGEVLKKGNIVGKVERDLTFEVTQKNYHINPLELINN
ncbi:MULTISPECIES: peptidoglycan DD-metalloendopeptidase family protein [unclassified Campylobacter]|uniref:murein hydrolase activator EnvC family protein n=1 Tax=unclassified Campylobacter TaxID=2593542 RepID=UPI001BDB1A5C|nr:MULTISPECIES: peptidoglycan DD-metalloendopeptidase family protein [unclassified Campylobacter]MBZ7975956.1 peptidoglycan DD-metalloendopeptidase family protein [Campylobacter sp. RM12637]MBZ7977526.1 peptidoglycan DD-metalloendopeptidase family protein [Campylobacter sp. RM12654]MBZ7979505.1 peptidoglycan DD-metalloendopeptidase family protein [Campylobacter sp. RM12642]MBZ7981178.1 peptidoglycan DD-metalloendopeptidase family protein [Campylobacter sp. RM12640]MBZ7983019.1 peptidoglycan D